MNRPKVVDKHGEGLKVDDRVMVDGALVATVLHFDPVVMRIEVQIDGDKAPVAYRMEPLTVRANNLESLGDGINQAMRATRGQPN